MGSDAGLERFVCDLFRFPESIIGFRYLVRENAALIRPINLGRAIDGHTRLPSIAHHRDAQPRSTGIS
jgi:hypothetical protein